MVQSVNNSLEFEQSKVMVLVGVTSVFIIFVTFLTLNKWLITVFCLFLPMVILIWYMWEKALEKSLIVNTLLTRYLNILSGEENYTFSTLYSLRSWNITILMENL